MDETIKTEFEDLACTLSPENLSCDGELSRTETKKRYYQIMKRWKELEKKVGYKVTEDDVFNWMMKKE